MADEQPTVSPAVANADNRTALESKSAQALKAAIAKVSEEPSPQPAAKAETPGVETVEPLPAEPAKEPVAETEPAQPIKASAALERKARATIRARKDAQEAQAARAAEARAMQEAAAAREEARAARELIDLLKADPMVALTKAGHDPARLVPDWLKKVAEPEKTPEQKAAEAAQAEIDKLKKWQEQQELRERNQAMTAQIATYQGQIAEAIADKDAFEYVHRDGGTEAVYKYITDTYELAVAESRAGRLSAAEQRTGKYTNAQLQELDRKKLARIAATDPAVFAKQMEAELRGKFATPRAAAAAAVVAEAAKPTGSLIDAARGVRSSKTLKQRQKQAAEPDDDEPRSPRGGNGVRTVSYKKPFKTSDLISDAIRAMTDAGRRH